MGWNHNFYISISDISSSGFRVNGTFQAGQNSYNAAGFNVYTSVDGLGRNNHTAVISSKGGSYSFSDYYSVSEYKDASNYTCYVGGDLSWSGNTADSGNPVSTTATVPARTYNAHGNPSFSASKTTVNYGESIKLSWAKSGTQGNANFNHFELYHGDANKSSNKLYSGSGTSMTVKPSDYTGAKGGTVTFSIWECHEWYGDYKWTHTDITVTVRSGVVSVYDDAGKKHVGLVSAYDSSGKQHYVLITAYDENGKAHNVV